MNILLLLIACYMNANAQNPAQNCMGAIPICQNTYTQSSSFSGPGSIIELNGSNQGCLTTGENNSVWYIFNTSTPGILVFTITPLISSDYDFAVWDLTDKSCNAIGGGLPPIRCNYASLLNSSPGGLTGLSASSSLPSIGAGGGSFSSAINASSGQTFVILINNSSASTAGYTIDFSGSTSMIQDNVSPFIKADTLQASCTGPANMEILLSENVICGSIAANGTDFSLSPGSASILSANSISCGTGSAYSNLISLNFSTALSPGTYTLSIVNGTDGNTLIDNCGNAALVGSSINFTVIPPVQLSVSTQYGCAGTPSGVITITNIGGTPPFQYQLNAAPYTTNNVFSGLFAGTYTLHIKDNNGCIEDTVINLTQGPAIQIISVVSTNLSCYGVNTGTALISAAGGIPPLSYAVGSSAYSSNNLISNLAPGNHILHIKDANGCIKDTIIFISSPGQISFNSLLVNNATCGLNNGSLLINAYGGSGALSYSLNSNPYQSGNSFINLNAGTYTVHVKDANNCIKDTLVAIQQISLVAISTINLVQPGCAGNSGSITINGTGGTTPYSYAINGSAYTTSNLFASLSSGSYTITIKDANGCTANSAAVLTSPSNLFFSNATIINPTCLIAGSITVNGTGGSSPYLFALGSGFYSGVNTFTPLVPGTYIVHIKDNNGCIHDTTIVLTNILLPAINNLVIINPSCSFPNAGSLQVNANGGVPPLTYSLNGAAYSSSNLFTTLSGGNYTVTVKDANGCTASSISIITPANTLNFTTFNHTNVGCNGTPLATINSTLGNGNAPYQYSINGGSFGASGNFSSLNAGIYTIVGKDASGCTISSIVSISSSAIVSINNIVITNSNCHTPPTGSINITGSVSALPISYTINYGAAISTGLFATLTPGIYTLSVQDANGCHKDSVVTILGPPPLYYSNAVIFYPPCFGGNGSISLQGNGGVPPYTYSLNGGLFSNASSWSSLPAGSYMIQLQDANGCLHDTMIDLIQPPTISISSIVISNASCSGIATGSITVTVTSGFPPFLYALDAGTFGSNNFFSGLAAGSHIIHVKDANGCIKDSVVVLSNNGNFLITGLILTSPSCHGSNNGAITIIASGGSSPYQYAINAGAYNTINSFSNLSSGTYTLHTQDNSGCFKDSVLLLSQPTILEFAAIQITPATCFGTASGAVVITGAGGTPPYQYKIDAGLFGTLSTFNNINAGSHTLVIKDSKSCIQDSVIQITQPAPLNFSGVMIVNPGCLGTVGLITVGGAGGVAPYTFAIGSGAYSANGTFNNLPGGTYTLHVKDMNGCVHDTSLTLVGSQLITVNAFSSTLFLCQNSNAGFINSIATSLNPPITYSYNGGLPQSVGFFTGLTAGTYTVHIEDQIGCFVDSIVTIQAAPPIQINSMITTPALCHNSFDGNIILNAIGGLGTLRYAINAGAFTFNNVFNNLNGATYTVHVKDSLSCQVDSVVNVYAPAAIYFSSINLSYPFCSNSLDGQITINAQGGQAPYLYAINTSLYTTNNLFQNLFQGTYTIHVKDYNGCIHDTVIQLTAANYMDFTNVNISDVLCKYGNDGSISLSILGGVPPYFFTLNAVPVSSTGFFSNLAAGAYTINVTDFLGCQSDTVIVVSEPLNSVEATVINITPNLCRGDSIGTITADGNGGTPTYTYSLNASLFQSAALFTGLAAGNYILTIKDLNGCIDDTLVSVLEPDTSVQLFLIGIKNQSCINVNDGSITVTSKFGFAPVNYYLNGTLFGADTFYNQLSPGNYIVEVKDNLGCKSTGKFEVLPTDRRPYIIIDSLGAILCEGDLTGAIDWHTINTFPPYYYTFDSVFIDTLSYVYGISNGTYFIQVVDSIGCRADTTITLVEGDKMDIDVVSTPALCQGLGDDGKAMAVVAGGESPFTFLWTGDIGNNTDEADQLMFGNQIAYVTDALGCTDTAHFIVDYDPCCLVNLPNAFSPNGDGKNDIFKVIKYGISTIASFEVYNRWGNRIFYTTSEADGWDGKYEGVDCDMGTYFYLLRYRCHLKNENILLKGDVTLLR